MRISPCLYDGLDGRGRGGGSLYEQEKLGAGVPVGCEGRFMVAETPRQSQGNLTTGLSGEARHTLHRLEVYTFPCQAESAREVGLHRRRESVLRSTR